MAKAAAAWSKTMEEVLHGINQVLSSMGLVEKEAPLQKMPEYNEVTEKKAAAIAELEKELLSSGGSETLLTEGRKKVLALPPAELLQKLKKGNLTAVLVLEAFQAKAIEESKRTNCIIEFIPEAKKLAEKLDSMKFSLTSDAHFPLHGLPISVKDCVQVQGHDSTIGLRKRVDQPAESDSVIVAVYKKLGAVPFVITNVPQICLSIGCSNPLWGETVNPHDLSRTSGGSSGGEGALIAGGGSVLGIGSDIGGSVRFPAAFCGIVGLKPTARRVSNKGLTSSLRGLVGFSGTVGLMGRDAAIVLEATKALFSSEMSAMDSNIPPLPWRDTLFTAKNKKVLRIGWYDYDGLFPVTPGVKRAMVEAVAAMKGQGHVMVPFAVPDSTEAVKLFLDFLHADQGATAQELWKGETVDPSLYWYKQFSSVPANLKLLSKPLLKHQYGEIASEVSISSITTAHDLWKRMHQRNIFAEKFQNDWKKLELHLVLCPVFPSPAPKKDGTITAKLSCAAAYSCLYNLLDYPAVSVPITKENEEDQKQLKDFVTTDYMHELYKEGTLGAQGMPLSVQLVALPYCEELLCRGMMDLSTAVDFTL